MASGDTTATLGNNSDRYGAVFDGVDDYVQVPHNADQLGSNLSNGFTISAWINPKSAGEGNSGVLITKSADNAAANGFKIRLQNTTDYIISTTFNVGGSTKSSGNITSYGDWKHILITISSGSLVNYYVNGVLNGTANQNLGQPISAITTTNNIRLGNQAAGTANTFDGTISKVKMWPKVLSSTERATDYAGGTVPGTIIDVPLKDNYDGVTNSGSYLIKDYANEVVADVSQITLAATTDKFIAIPISGRNQKVAVIGVNREA